MSRRPSCACGKRAEFLCDELVPITAERRLAALRKQEEPSGTCDRPLCRSCRVQVGVTFYCGRRPAAGVESVDRCPEHAPDGRVVRL